MTNNRHRPTGGSPSRRRYPGLFPPQAQEAAQEVFLKLYIELRQGTKIENWRAWLFRVAHNALGEEADHVEAVKVLEQWAGQEIA